MHPFYWLLPVQHRQTDADSATDERAENRADHSHTSHLRALLRITVNLCRRSRAERQDIPPNQHRGRCGVWRLGRPDFGYSATSSRVSPRLQGIKSNRPMADRSILNSYRFPTSHKRYGSPDAKTPSWCIVMILPAYSGGRITSKTIPVTSHIRLGSAFLNNSKSSLLGTPTT